MATGKITISTLAKLDGWIWDDRITRSRGEASAQGRPLLSALLLAGFADDAEHRSSWEPLDTRHSEG